MRDHLAFLLNGDAVSLGGIDPRTTLLDWLREVRGLRGTKEGCNEGDCGACTVGLTRLVDGRPRREAVNACIQLLPMLDGAAVTTVEAVAGPDRLHPAQAAMIDHHAAQCGFCTPGIVMSLWCADGPEPRPALEDRLAGNLCRCTGYGPILMAGERMADHPAPDWEADLGPALRALPTGPLALTGGGARAFAPDTEAALSALRAEHPEAVMVAGATDVALWLTKRLDQPEALIFLNRIKGFDRIAPTPSHLEVGAGATWTVAAPALAALAPDLGELVRRFASVQVRNSATVGGNIANGSPIGDGAPALIALGADLVLRRDPDTRTLPLEDFFLAYGQQDLRAGEHVSALHIPHPADPASLKIHKVSKRFDQDISAVLGAFLIETAQGRVTRARIAFGGMAGTPKRARAVEDALIGRPWTRATVDAALPAFAEDFTPLSDHRASAAYRLTVARNLLLRTYLETATPAATRLARRGGAA